MNFETNINSSPAISDPAINLDDWKTNSTSFHLTGRSYKVMLPSKDVVFCNTVFFWPADDLVALSNDDIAWLYNETECPTVKAIAYTRQLTHIIDDVVPALAYGSFFTTYQEELRKAVQARMNRVDGRQEWADYYATSIKEFPIITTIFTLLPDHLRTAIANSYFDQFADTKLFTHDEMLALTTEEKVKALTFAVKNKSIILENIIDLITEDDVFDIETAFEILNSTQSSVVLGKLSRCIPLTNNPTNANNLIALWVRACIAEKINVNDSVYYMAMKQIELDNELDILAPYVVKDNRRIPQNTQMSPYALQSSVNSLHGNDSPIGL